MEQIRKEANAINPNWDAEYFYPAQEQAKRALAAEAELEKRGLSEGLEKRLSADFDALRITCGGRWEAVEYMDAMRQNVYLMNHGGTPEIGGGPGECSRVSCANNAAIVWCNDVRPLPKYP